MSLVQAIALILLIGFSIMEWLGYRQVIEENEKLKIKIDRLTIQYRNLKKEIADIKKGK